MRLRWSCQAVTGTQEEKDEVDYWRSQGRPHVVPMNRCLTDNQHRTCQGISPCHAILLWRTGDIPYLKGLIAIPSISLIRSVTGD
jgi:hypothetical protein